MFSRFLCPILQLLCLWASCPTSARIQPRVSFRSSRFLDAHPHIACPRLAQTSSQEDHFDRFSNLLMLGDTTPEGDPEIPEWIARTIDKLNAVQCGFQDFYRGRTREIEPSFINLNATSIINNWTTQLAGSILVNAARCDTSVENGHYLSEKHPLKQSGRLMSDAQTELKYLKHWNCIATNVETDDSFEGTAVRDFLKNAARSSSSFNPEEDLISIYRNLALVGTPDSQGSDKDKIANVFAVASVYLHCFLYWERLAPDLRTLWDLKLEFGKVDASVSEGQGVTHSQGMRRSVLLIGDAVSTSAWGGRRGSGKELLLRIARLAAALNRLAIIIPANGRLEEYYKSLGFERIGVAANLDRKPLMAYTRPLQESLDVDPFFEMVNIAVR